MEKKKCLKCGRDCSQDQAFCGECLNEMERYPVKPGVVVLLPQQQRSKPAPRRHTAPSPEEVVVKLKKRVLILWVALILTLTVLGVLGWLTAAGFFSSEETKLLPGQNYSAETSASEEGK
jgi:hypothetical protein